VGPHKSCDWVGIGGDLGGSLGDLAILRSLSLPSKSPRSPDEGLIVYILSIRGRTGVKLSLWKISRWVQKREIILLYISTEEVKMKLEKYLSLIYWY
jgi:hypothetical protein